MRFLGGELDAKSISYTTLHTSDRLKIPLTALHPNYSESGIRLTLNPADAISWVALSG